MTSHHLTRAARPALAPPSFSLLLAPVLLVLLAPTPAHAQAKGAVCPVNGYTAAATQATGGQNLVCSSLTWNYVPYQFGASAGTCPGASNVDLGMIQWTGSRLSGLHRIGLGIARQRRRHSTLGPHRGNHHQLDQQRQFRPDMDVGHARIEYRAHAQLNRHDDRHAAQSLQHRHSSERRHGLDRQQFGRRKFNRHLKHDALGHQHRRCRLFHNATTNAGYAVYGTMTAHGNTGYAGYFLNTDTSGNRITASHCTHRPAPAAKRRRLPATATTGIRRSDVYASYANSTGTTYRRGIACYRPRQHRLCRLLHQHRHEQHE